MLSVTLVALVLGVTPPTNAAVFGTMLGHTIGDCCPCPQQQPRFVAVGTNALATSDDGAAWSSQSVPAGGWVSIAFGGGRYCAIDGVNTRQSMYSANGVDWTLGGNLPPTPVGTLYKHVIFDGSKFIAVGEDNFTAGTVKTGIATSADCVAWSAISPSGLAANFKAASIAYDGSVYAMTGTNSNPTNIHVSTDLTNWTPKNGGNLSYPSVTYANGRFVALSNTSSYAARSIDAGVTWTTHFHTFGGNTALGDGVTGSSSIYTGATSNRMIYSADGATWNVTLTANITGGVVWSPVAALFVAVGNGVSLASSDGTTWVQYVFPFNAAGIGARSN